MYQQRSFFTYWQLISSETRPRHSLRCESGSPPILLDGLDTYDSPEAMPTGKRFETASDEQTPVICQGILVEDENRPLVAKDEASV